MNTFGIIGLGVMGKSLSRNLAGKGIRLSLYNRHVPGLEEQVARNFIAEHQLHNAEGFDDLEAFVRSLERPRKILLMIPAGAAVDGILEALSPLLFPGDVLMDGGNSHYKDSRRRMEQLKKQGIQLLGVGISGGEEGARTGPAIMPGGDVEAYHVVAPVLESAAATDAWGKPCCRYMGKGGAGHFVKMVHNGLEYAEMQLISEVYSLLRYACGLSPEAIATELDRWNQTELQNYLLGITVEILQHYENGALTLDTILDIAGNKGTGSWTTIAACELGVPIPVITAALYARYTSTVKEERIQASGLFTPLPQVGALEVGVLKNAYSAARIINHHQGLHLIAEASRYYRWGIDLPALARVWTNGCIIQSKLMQMLAEVLSETDRVLTHPRIVAHIDEQIPALARVSAHTAGGYIPIPCMESAFSYFKAYIQRDSSANLIQAQRDFFGAHTYQRKTDSEGPAIHTLWTK